MATHFRLLDPGRQFFDANGAVLAGGLINTYTAGTTSAKATYQDNAGVSAHTNPVVLDAAGRVPAPLWGTTGDYKIAVTDSAGGAIFTEDNVTPVQDETSATGSEWLASGLTTTRTGNTTFTLVGDRTTTFHVGRRLKLTDTAFLYASITATAYSDPNTTVTVVVDGGTALSTSLSTVSYAINSANNPSVPHLTIAPDLTLKNPATSASPATFVLQTGDTAVVATDVLGKIQFQAPDEAGGTDSILVAASIEAVATDTFAADNNATKLSFKTGASEAATEKMSISSVGNVTMKQTATGDDTPMTLLLQTGETDIAAADVLGKVQFQAPDEGTGTDAILVAAEIAAVSEGDFSSSSNATKLSFKTGASEAAAEKMSISSVGNVTMKQTATGDDTPMTLSLQTGEIDIAANDVLGKIEFNAPDEGTGTDALLVAGAIDCVSEGDFSSSSNASKLSFRTGASEAATEKMSISSVGNVTMKQTATGDNTPMTLSLTTGETDIEAADVLGKIEFKAPDEGTGTDALLVAGAIDCVSEGDFSSSSNASKLSFRTGASETATEKMSISSVGNVTMKQTATGDNTPITLSLTTGETNIEAADVLGKIEFSAPDEGTGTDALLVAGAIDCVSEGDFSSSSNASKLSFRTGASEAATEKMSISSVGNVTMKQTATGDDTPMTLSLTTGETNIEAADVLGKIEFSAPDEGTGTDALLVAGAIDCVSEGDFSSSSNASKLSFRTGASEAATEKMSISSVGNVTMKQTATTDDTPMTLLLQTGETDIAVSDVLGKIQFQAPDEGAGTDAILVAAEVAAISEGDFSSSNNATKLAFKTGASEAATEKMSISSTGNVTMKQTETGDDTPMTLLLQTGETDIAANDVLGKIEFQAPDEGAGTDAILVAAAIEAVSEGDFSSSNNATKLSFKTGASEAATEKMSISSGGDLTIAAGGDLITATAGTSNFRAGVNAGTNIASGGNYNMLIGAEAGNDLTTGDDNTVLGFAAFEAATTNSFNTAIGSRTLKSANKAGDPEVVATSNSAVGYNTLTSLTTGSYNTGCGSQSLQNTTTALSNTVAGYASMLLSTTGSYNHAYGHAALYNCRTGYGNVGIGYLAVFTVDSGFYNVGIGHQSIYYGTGSYNTGVGSFTLLNTAAGAHNTALGYQAGDVITSGDQNICIGAYTDPSANSGDLQIVIGYNITGGEDSQVTIGSAGNVIQNEYDTDANWTRTSDRRKKRNIEDDTLGLEFINNLRTVTHQWKPSNEFPEEWDEYSEENTMNLDAVMHGMIAQEVKEALDKSGCDTFAGWDERSDGSQTVSREMFVIPLIKAVQELSAEVKELKEKLNA